MMSFVKKLLQCFFAFMLYFTSSGPAVYDSTIDFRVFRGKEIHPYLATIAELRVKLFFDFPYLYRPEGPAEDEDVSYYQDSSDAIMVGAFKNQTLVGLAVGLPLKEYNYPNENFYSVEKFKPFGLDVHDYYYISEVFVIPDHQRKGIALELLMRIGVEVKAFSQFKYMSLLSVEREDLHPLKPKNYISSDGLWTKAHFSKTSIRVPFEWMTLQPDKTIKMVENQMSFWVKPL